MDKIKLHKVQVECGNGYVFSLELNEKETADKINEIVDWINSYENNKRSLYELNK